MEVLGKFGFSLELFIAQIVNFLILAFIFKKFLYKPIFKTLQERKAKIEQGLTDAEHAQKDREQADEERHEIIKKATNEAEKILKDATEIAESIQKETIEKTRAQGNKIIEDAKNAAALEMERMQNTIQTNTLTMAQKILESTLSDTFSKDEKEKIIKRNIKTFTNK